MTGIIRGMTHTYEITPQLYMLALATATGASTGRHEADCFVVEQGGASIPCLVVTWEELYGDETEWQCVAFPIGEMLAFLGLPRTSASSGTFGRVNPFFAAMRSLSAWSPGASGG